MNKTDNENKTRVRYRVNHNDLNYEYVLHSNKHRFLKNLADVVNVVEYCVGRELKNNGHQKPESIPRVRVTRLVNDKIDEKWEKESYVFTAAINTIINQVIDDIIQSHS